nr:MAG TPA: hypothetical protein [Caudoviricetes sp.]
MSVWTGYAQRVSLLLGNAEQKAQRAFLFCLWETPERCEGDIWAAGSRPGTAYRTTSSRKPLNAPLWRFLIRRQGNAF